MGIESVRPNLKPGDMERVSSSTPPGFVSQTSFVLRKVSSTPVSRQVQSFDFDINDEDAFKMFLNKRPWIVHDHTTPSSEAVRPMIRPRQLHKVSEAKVLVEAPVFHPNEEEFSDTLSYIASLREKAEPYGICCVVPPSSWKPPCLLKEKKIWEASKFSSQVQLFGGGSDDSASEKAKLCTISRGPVYTLEEFKTFADAEKSRKDEVLGSKNSSPSQEPKEPTVADIEKEYREIVESPDVEIGVIYGNDIDTRTFGSGFSKSEDHEPSEYCKYRTSGWNLNNTAKLPGSLLSFEDCGSVCVPRLGAGMCLSSQIWKSEKVRLYSLCYLHFGAPRVWYSVAGCDGSKFKATMKSLIPETSEEQPNKSRQSVSTVSPYTLKMEGIPVTRCVQNPGQYVIIFPGSYSSAFDCGFNCLEKVNFAPLDWLPHGDITVLQNQEKSKKSVISFDNLVLRAAREAVKCLISRKNTANCIIWKNACGKDGIFTNFFKSHMKQEKNRREFLNWLESKRMDKSYDDVSKRECCVCFADLHLSAVQCSCFPDRFSCLSHLRKLCDCPSDSKSFLYRYTTDELNCLVEALEGNKPSAMYKWEKIEREICVSTAITSSQSIENSKETDEVISTLSNITMIDVASGMEQQPRVKERKIADILSVKERKDDEKGSSVKPCSNKSPRRCGSSAGNTAKKHKPG